MPLQMATFLMTCGFMIGTPVPCPNSACCRSRCLLRTLKRPATPELRPRTAGNWTAYQPNELVCDICMSCASPLANRPQGSMYVLGDNGTYLECSNSNDTTWQDASVISRSLGAQARVRQACRCPRQKAPGAAADNGC